MTFEWAPAPRAADYVGEVGSAPGWSDLLVVPVAGTRSVASAPPGLYYVRVRGRNACGVGPGSNEVVVSVP